MSVPIQNAKDTPLNQNSGTLPCVGDTIKDWFQPLTFSRVTKSVVNFQVVESLANTDFMGIWQPFRSRDLEMMPQGQRKWKWFSLHCDTTLQLTPDDIITYLGNGYRVMQVLDYSIYGYMEYHFIEDYS